MDTNSFSIFRKNNKLKIKYIKCKKKKRVLRIIKNHRCAQLLRIIVKLKPIIKKALSIKQNVIEKKKKKIGGTACQYRETRNGPLFTRQ